MLKTITTDDIDWCERIVQKVFARLRAKRFDDYWEERFADDMRAEAFAALCERAAAFNPQNAVSFRDWARKRIRGAMHDYLKRELRHSEKEITETDLAGEDEETDGIILGYEDEGKIARHF